MSDPSQFLFFDFWFCSQISNTDSRDLVFFSYNKVPENQGRLADSTVKSSSYSVRVGNDKVHARREDTQGGSGGALFATP